MDAETLTKLAKDGTPLIKEKDGGGIIFLNTFSAWQSSIWAGGFDNDVYMGDSCDHLLEIATIYKSIGEMKKREIISKIHKIAPELLAGESESEERYSQLEQKFTSLPNTTTDSIRKIDPGFDTEKRHAESSGAKPPFTAEFKKEVAVYAAENGISATCQKFNLNPL